MNSDDITLEELLDLIEYADPQNPDLDFTFIEGLSTYYCRGLCNVNFENMHLNAPLVAAVIYLNAATSITEYNTYVNHLVELWTKYTSWTECATTKECFYHFITAMRRKQCLPSPVFHQCVDIALNEFRTNGKNVTCIKEASAALIDFYTACPDAIKNLDEIVKIFENAEAFIVLDYFATVILNTDLISRIETETSLRERVLARIRSIGRAGNGIAGLAAQLLKHLKVSDLKEELEQLNCQHTKVFTLFKVLELQLVEHVKFANDTFELLKEVADTDVDYIVPFLTKFVNDEDMPSLIHIYEQCLLIPQLCSSESLREVLNIASGTMPKDDFIALLEKLAPRIIQTPSEFLRTDVTSLENAIPGFQKVLNIAASMKDLSHVSATIDFLIYFEDQLEFEMPENFKQVIHDAVLQNEDEFLARTAVMLLGQKYQEWLIQWAESFFVAKSDTELRVLLISSIETCVESNIEEAKSIAISLIKHATEGDVRHDVQEAALQLAENLEKDIDEEVINQLRDDIENWEEHQASASELAEGKGRLDDILRGLESPDHEGHDNCISKECY